MGMSTYDMTTTMIVTTCKNIHTTAILSTQSQIMQNMGKLVRHQLLYLVSFNNMAVTTLPIVQNMVLSF